MPFVQFDVCCEVYCNEARVVFGTFAYEAGISKQHFSVFDLTHLGVVSNVR